MEDDKNGRQSKWQTTKIEDDQNGKRPKWKTNKRENNQNLVVSDVQESMLGKFVDTCCAVGDELGN